METGTSEAAVKLTQEIVGRMVSRHSSAAVLFHHAVAERLGLGPSDLNCLHLLHERGAMSGSDLVEITGLTSGAITGVVARLERGGFLRREPDPHDGRKQVLTPVQERVQDIHEVFGPIRQDLARSLADFDDHQLAAIAEFLTNTATLIYRHIALLRAETISMGLQEEPK